MNQLNLESLLNYEGQIRNQENWVSVGLDTGGIAAGGDKVFNTLKAKIEDQCPDFELRTCGSLGLSFADPVVQVKKEGMPLITYGSVTPEIAASIVETHLLGDELVDHQIIATRERKKTIDAPTNGNPHSGHQ